MVTTAYESVPGFFIHDNPNVTVSDPIPPSFGLLDSTSPDRWSTLFHQIAQLNSNAKRSHGGEEVQFKLFFLGRHGEGFHNVAEAKYGTPAWDAYWSKLDGDGEIVWGPDAELTPLGISQAQTAHNAFLTEFGSGLRIPDATYVSPLSRALRTFEITFDGLFSGERHGEDEGRVQKATVLEACREQYGVHTCDLRRSRTFIFSTFPHITALPPKLDEHSPFPLTENDELWTADARETNDHVATRVKTVLDVVFEKERGDFISITAHSGMINGFLASIGRPSFSLGTGGGHSFLPFLILPSSRFDSPIPCRRPARRGKGHTNTYMLSHEQFTDRVLEAESSFLLFALEAER